MALMNILVNLPSQSAQDLKDICNLEPGGATAARNLSNLFLRMVGGNSYGTITVDSGAVQATATATFSSTGPANGETCTIAGVTITAVTSGASTNEFNINATPATVAENFASCINASPDLAGIVTASRVNAVVTLTAAVAGDAGNGLEAIDVDLSNVAIVSFAGGSDGTQYVLDLS